MISVAYYDMHTPARVADASIWVACATCFSGKFL